MPRVSSKSVRSSSSAASSSRRVQLRRISTQPPRGTVRARIKKLTDALEEELAELDDLLYYARQHGVLIVLQGRDTAGKDGTIRKVLDHCNAIGVRVESFKAPTEEERGHDFLWRIHAKAPARGEIVMFNRSHYEDVVVTRVHDLFPPEEIEPRYDAINDFERLLGLNQTIIFKFFLHISLEEQGTRLLEREQEREKAWKLAAGDWKERSYWNAYTDAYDVALTRCSPVSVPWHVIPADQKWYRNYLVMKTVVEGLRPYKAQWLTSLSELGVKRLAEIKAYKASIAAASK
jgi:PPK2 family polyphosphate:nucleotide phosphotransferase